MLFVHGDNQNKVHRAVLAEEFANNVGNTYGGSSELGINKRA